MLGIKPSICHMQSKCSIKCTVSPVLSFVLVPVLCYSSTHSSSTLTLSFSYSRLFQLLQLGFSFFQRITSSFIHCHPSKVVSFIEVLEVGLSHLILFSYYFIILNMIFFISNVISLLGANLFLNKILFCRIMFSLSKWCCVCEIYKIRRSNTI